MALVALAVALDSSGPVIYGARRVGRGGGEFTMWKFRSMARGAEAAGPAVTASFDFRVTRVGAFLRRTKLDELPQLSTSWPARCRWSVRDRRRPRTWHSGGRTSARC